MVLEILEPIVTVLYSHRLSSFPIKKITIPDIIEEVLEHAIQYSVKSEIKMLCDYPKLIYIKGF